MKVLLALRIKDLLVLVALITLVIWAIVSKLKTKKVKSSTYSDPRPFYRPGSFRGERGSPGTSPKIVGAHSVNCECLICVYGHDPDAYTCQCRSCEGYRRGKPIH